MSIHPHVSNCHLKTIKSKTDQASSSHGEEITPGRKKSPLVHHAFLFTVKLISINWKRQVG